MRDASDELRRAAQNIEAESKGLQNWDSVKNPRFKHENGQNAGYHEALQYSRTRCSCPERPDPQVAPR